MTILEHFQKVDASDIRLHLLDNLKVGVAGVAVDTLQGAITLGTRYLTSPKEEGVGYWEYLATNLEYDSLAFHPLGLTHKIPQKYAETLLSRYDSSAPLLDSTHVLEALRGRDLLPEGEDYWTHIYAYGKTPERKCPDCGKELGIRYASLPARVSGEIGLCCPDKECGFTIVSKNYVTHFNKLR